MPNLAVLAVGQSNSRSTKTMPGGDMSIPANCSSWNNDELKFGNKFVPFKLGRYPFNILAEDGVTYSNNLSLSFCREASATFNPRLVMVAKGGHKIECFIKSQTRKAYNWTFPSRMSEMARYIYQKRYGISRALRYLKKQSFDVVLFHQGEANEGMSSAEYEKRFLAIRKDLFAMGAITRSTPIIVGGLFPSGPYYATHKATIQRISAMFPQVKFVDSNGLTSNDGVHFDGVSITTLGQRYWTAFAG